jgi:hypothetical protein
MEEHREREIKHEIDFSNASLRIRTWDAEYPSSTRNLILPMNQTSNKWYQVKTFTQCSFPHSRRIAPLFLLMPERWKSFVTSESFQSHWLSSLQAVLISPTRVISFSGADIQTDKSHMEINPGSNRPKSLRPSQCYE